MDKVSRRTRRKGFIMRSKSSAVFAIRIFADDVGLSRLIVPWECAGTRRP